MAKESAYEEVPDAMEVEDTMGSDEAREELLREASERIKAFQFGN